MEAKTLYDNWQVKATKYGSFVLISAEELLLEPERFECDKNTKDFNCAIVMLYPEEIDAIHAALHAGDEPAPEPKKEERTCGGCKYFGNDDPYPCVGHCLRYAPRWLSGVGTGESEQLWPLIGDHHWCGEWEPK